MSAKNEPNKPDDSNANEVDVPRLVRCRFCGELPKWLWGHERHRYWDGHLEHACKGGKGQIYDLHGAQKYVYQDWNERNEG